MTIKTLFHGALVACIINGAVAVMPALVAPKPQSSVQLVAQTSNQLSQDSINKILKEIQAAQQQKDVEGVLKFVAPFVVSNITVESGRKQVTMELEGKDEHRQLLKETFDGIKQSEIVNQRIIINLYQDGQLGIAKVFTVKKITSKDGKQFFSSSNDTIRFALIDNQPMIVSMSIDGWLAERSPRTSK